MNYKVNNKVVLKVEHQKSGKKRILTSDPLPNSTIIEQSFSIIAINSFHQLYTILIDDDMIGWTIGEFLTTYADVDKKYLNHKFYDIPESLILRKAKN